MDHNYWVLIERIFCGDRLYELEEIQKGLRKIFEYEPDPDEIENVYCHLIDKRSKGNTKT